MQYDGREYYRAEGSARSSSTAHVPAQQCYEKRSQGINQRKIPNIITHGIFDFKLI